VLAGKSSKRAGPKAANACLPDSRTGDHSRIDRLILSGVASPVTQEQPKNTVARTSGDALFPRAARLTRPADFKRVFSEPTVSADSMFKVLARSGLGDRARLGMAVSRNTDKRAARRNHIKRIIRESFRQRFGAEAPVIDFIVLARKESATMSNEQLRDSLNTHWTRILARLSRPAQRR